MLVARSGEELLKICEKEKIHCAYWADAEAALNALLGDK